MWTSSCSGTSLRPWITASLCMTDRFMAFETRQPPGKLGGEIEVPPSQLPGRFWPPSR